MRLQLLSAALLGVVLGACSSPTPQTIKGKIYQSVSSGGKALAGAKVTISAGNETKTATTAADGSFSIEMPFRPSTFSITAEPPTSTFGSVSYDGLPFEAYASEFGAANEFNIYLPGGSAASNPGFPARFGCIGGTLTDGGNPVVSTPAAITSPPNRTSPTACDGSVPANLLVSTTQLRPGENGLVLFGGIRAVTTRAGGNYLVPVVTTNNGWAFSGSLWAGNYTGTDTGNPATAFEYYWDKFAHVPQTEAMLNGSTQTQNLALEAFNPSTNPAKVTTFKVSHDTSALSGFNFADPEEAFSYSIPSFEHAITSSGIQLGRYFVFSAGPRNLRVPKLQNKQGQQIQVENVALNLVNGAESDATFWRDGTDLSSEVKADFLGIPSPQAPANNASGTSRKPTLSWKAVAKAKLYQPLILDGNTLVWYGLTAKNSIAVPVNLSANKKYSWGVIAFDQFTLTDAVGREPSAIPASVRYGLGGSRWAAPDNPLRQYSRQLLEQYAAAGYTPNLDFGGINLKAKGYRESYSELSAFTTGQ
jgi:hypothetical protein